MSNVLYTILTCDAYYKTRCQWQKDTWLTQTENHVFLGKQDNPEWNMVGWNTADNYDSCPIKLMNFVRHYKLKPNIEWVVIADDDTFIFPKRLEMFLGELDSTRLFYIGTTCNDGCVFMSGGAGFVVSRALFNKLKEYSLSASDTELHRSKYSDLSFGHWAIACNAEYIPNNRFHGDYKEEYGSTEISCHYVTKDGFYTLASNMK